MKPPDIIEITLEVIKVFEKLNIRYYIGGSLASSAFGIARSTLDVDIIADIKPEQTPLLEESFREEFYIDIEMVQNAVASKTFFNLIHLESLFKIDVFILRDRPFDKQVLSRCVEKAVSEDTTKKVYFPTPEDIILAKLEWYASGKEASDRQWNDILGVLKVQGSQLDFNYMRQWASKLSVSKLINKALDEAGIYES